MTTDLVSTAYATILARYATFREIGRAQNPALLKYVGRDAVLKSARRLGLVGPGRELLFDNESEIAVLYDHCLFDHREVAGGKGSRNAIERCYRLAPPPVGSDERLVLEAMLQARYCLVQVESVVPGVGCHVRDVLRRQSFLLVDVGFSQSAYPGSLLATRIIAPEGLHMSTGAALPVSRDILDVVEDEIDELLGPEQADGPATLSPRQDVRLAAILIRACLDRGASASVEYRD